MTTTKPISVLTLALVALVIAIVGCVEPKDPMVRGAELYESCLPCHGEHGEGFQPVLAPAVAGLPQWYIEAQLMKFRAFKRGYHFDDLAGLRMRPMALSMSTEDDVRTVAAYIAQMPRPMSAATVQGGDVNKGKGLYATCTACHGANGEGNPALNAPAIAGADDWYLLEQLVKFKKKMRGDPLVDPIGATMQAMTATLPDEQSMKDVVAYIKTLPPPPPGNTQPIAPTPGGVVAPAAPAAPAPAAPAPAAPAPGGH